MRIKSFFSVAIIAVVLSCMLYSGAGAALTAARNTPSRTGQVFELGVATGVKIYQGALVAVNSSGYVTPGATSTTLVGLGRAEAYVDNTAGQNGDVNIRVSRGIFQYANSSAGDAIANDDIGKICYMVDDATVALTNGSDTRSPAGRIFGVDSSGVWVEFLHFSAPGTVVSADITDGTIISVDIASATIATANIAADAVTNTILANITRGSVKTGGAANAPTDLDAKTKGQVLVGDGTDITSAASSALAGNLFEKVTVTTEETSGTVAFTAAQAIGGLILRDPVGGPVSDTFPTAAAIVAAIPNAIAGSSFEFTIKNTADAAETITMQTNTGLTLVGTMTIAQNNSKRFMAVVTNAGSGTEAVTIYSLGTVVH